MKARGIVCLVAIMFSLSLPIPKASALSVGNTSFRGAGVILDLDFPKEAHPADSITLNLTITALTGLKVQNFTLLIEVFVDTGWQQTYREQVLSLSMVQNDTLKKMVWFTLPLDSQEALRCYMYVQTDKAPGLPQTYIFYTTYVRTKTYDELLANYTELRADYVALDAQYKELNSTHNSFVANYSRLLTEHANYTALKTSYETLETDFRALNQSYYSLMEEKEFRNTVADLAVTKTILYVLVVIVLALVALIIYRKISSKPYVILRKETVSMKPD